MSHSGDESVGDEEGPQRAKARKVATKVDDKVTTPKKEKAAIRRPSIQTEEVKSMIADVDSLLSKSNKTPEKEKVKHFLSAPLGRSRIREHPFSNYAKRGEGVLAIYWAYLVL